MKHYAAFLLIIAIPLAANNPQPIPVSLPLSLSAIPLPTSGFNIFVVSNNSNSVPTSTTIPANTNTSVNPAMPNYNNNAIIPSNQMINPQTSSSTQSARPSSSSTNQAALSPSLSSQILVPAATTTLLGVRMHMAIGLGVTIVSVLAAWGRIKFLADQTSNPANWSGWQKDVPYKALKELSEAAIIVDLWLAVCDRYDADYQKDLLYVVSSFFDDIHKERAQVTALLWWYTVGYSCGLAKVMRIDEEAITALKERRERLDLLHRCMHTLFNNQNIILTAN